MVMKSIGLHPKDLKAAAAYLETSADPIPYPSQQDLDDWTGANPQVMDILNELQTASLRNQIRTERMAVILTAILKKVIKLDKAAGGPPMEASETTETVVPLLEPEQKEGSSRMEAGDTSNSKE